MAKVFSFGIYREMAHPVYSLKVAEMSKVYENTFSYIINEI